MSKQMIHFVEKPIERSAVRRFFGREFYIARRFLKWHFSGTNFSKIDHTTSVPNVWIEHKSTLLRKLKDVDMYLQYNKITNLNLAVAKINGVVIKPGETFSIWRMVGRPTKRKGYKQGLTIAKGQPSQGIGGRLCQLSNLIHWMVLHSELTITEHHHHDALDLFPDFGRQIPFGTGTSISYNYIDYRVKNETSNGYQLKLWVDGEYLCGELRAAEQ